MTGICSLHFSVTSQGIFRENTDGSQTVIPAGTRGCLLEPRQTHYSDGPPRERQYHVHFYTGEFGRPSWQLWVTPAEINVLDEGHC